MLAYEKRRGVLVPAEASGAGTDWESAGSVDAAAALDDAPEDDFAAMIVAFARNFARL